MWGDGKLVMGKMGSLDLLKTNTHKKKKKKQTIESLTFPGNRPAILVTGIQARTSLPWTAHPRTGPRRKARHLYAFFFFFLFSWSFWYSVPQIEACSTTCGAMGHPSAGDGAVTPVLSYLSGAAAAALVEKGLDSNVAKAVISFALYRPSRCGRPGSGRGAC